MKLIKEKKNLFTLDTRYSLAHCISADYSLSAGIAKEFQKRFHIKQDLNNMGNHIFPDCILIEKHKRNIYNLVTKRYYYNKPNYGNLALSLILMKNILISNDTKYLGIPKIGCGLDKLQWGNVEDIITKTFNDLDIEIRVCYL